MIENPWDFSSEDDGTRTRNHRIDSRLRHPGFSRRKSLEIRAFRRVRWLFGTFTDYFVFSWFSMVCNPFSDTISDTQEGCVDKKRRTLS